MVRAALRLVAVAVSLGAAGCGASSVRVALGPTLDTRGRAGVEASASLAIGWPLDWTGQSRHFLQGRATVGGDFTGGERHTLLRGDLDTLHWALDRLDVRAGAGFARRLGDGGPGDSSVTPSSWSAGAWLGVLGVAHQNDGGHPMVHQLSLGPELRAEALWLDGGGTRGLFSLPLVVEVNLLAAGD